MRRFSVLLGLAAGLVACGRSYRGDDLEGPITELPGSPVGDAGSDSDVDAVPTEAGVDGPVCPTCDGGAACCAPNVCRSDGCGPCGIDGRSCSVASDCCSGNCGTTKVCEPSD